MPPVNLDNFKFFYVIFPYSAGGNHLCNLLSTHEVFYNRFTSDDYYNHLLQSYKNKLLLEPTIENFLKSNNYLTIPKDEKEVLGSLSRIYNAHEWTQGDIISGMPRVDGITKIAKGDFTDFEIIHKTVKAHFSLPNSELENFKSNKKIICQTHGLDLAFLYQPNSKDKILKQLWHTLQIQKISGIVMTVPKLQGRAYKRTFIANKNLIDDIKKQNYNFPYKVNDITFLNENNGIQLDTDLFCENDGAKYLQELIYEKFNILLPNFVYELHKIWLEIVDKSIEIAESK